MRFTRMLPALLNRTDVVLELRDSRLPLTSINRTLEGTLIFHCTAFSRYLVSHRPSRTHMVPLEARGLVSVLAA